MTDRTAPTDRAALLDRIQTQLTTRLVVGETVERNGTTIVPLTRVSGGAGGGGPAASDDTGGLGFGLRATPVGAYVLREDRVSWRPALDLTRLLLRAWTLAVVLVAAVCVVRSRGHGAGRPAVRGRSR